MTEPIQPDHRGFVARHLDPASSLGEIVFGLIMVLTITLGTGVATLAEPGARRALIGAAVGCNLAWGIIDGAMYIMNETFQRARRFRVIAAIRRSKDRDEVLRAIANELDPGLEAVSESAERRRFYEHIIEVAGSAELPRTHFHRDDFMGALAAFLLVIVSAAPATIPFLVIEDPRTALRISNALLLGMLFFVGWAWAGYTNIPRWRMACALTGIGVVLVAIAIPLGG